MNGQNQLHIYDATTRVLEHKLENRINEIAPLIYRKRVHLPSFRMKRGRAPGAESPAFNDSQWEEFRIPGSWGAYLDNFWFRTTFDIPDDFAGERICLILRPSRTGGLRGAEGLVYIDGNPFQSIQVNRQEVLLQETAEPGGSHLLAIELYSGLTHEKHPFEVADLAVIDRPASDFYYDAFVALDAARAVDPRSPIRGQMLRALDSAFLMVDFREAGSPAFYKSVEKAGSFFRSELAQIRDGAEKPVVTCVGHAHLDTVWLWTLDQTRRKAARTFSNALRAMEQYPGYHFLASQAQHYDFVKRHYPSVYETVKKRIAEGRWEAPGGMWVEPDCNLPAGESLIRQFIFGKRFFKEQLGVDSTVMWFPDSFGYSAALPQIAAKCGMKYFVTNKLYLNDTNPFPYDTFWWQGIDGTRLLAHFLTTPTPGLKRTYNGNFHPSVMKGCWDVYRQKRFSDEVLMAFGWGDGGGGPTKEMLEVAARVENYPGLPRCNLGTSQGFFDRLLADLPPGLPVWNGELYLEYHRGTLTSEGWVKRANRKNEILYHDAEILSSLAMLGGEDYPSGEFAKGWEILLRNQFHDILPGSSIAEAYEDSRREHEEVRRLGRNLRDSAMQSLARRIDTTCAGAPSARASKAVIVWNTLSWLRSDVASIPLDGEAAPVVLDENGAAVPQQVVHLVGGGTELHFLAADVPSMGSKVFHLSQSRGVAKGRSRQPLTVTKRGMESGDLKLDLDETGAITSLLDKRFNRQVLPPGSKGNLLQIFEDKPLSNSAWDISEYIDEKRFDLGAPAEVKIVEEGPLRAGVSFAWKFLDSTITQTICIHAHTPRIDFDTRVDWNQSELLMKAAFPVDVLARHAAYEIQFGNIERPTHRNTSWQQAMFEVAAHKWVDLSESGYGVSLLNDCKYGHDVKENVMRITLLRSPISPDPKSDRGSHEMVYSLFPHSGDWREGGTVREAYQLNYPLIAGVEDIHDGEVPPRYSFVSVSSPNVIVETVKRAEESDSVVARVYECFGQRGDVELQFAAPVLSAHETDLLEKDPKKVRAKGNSVTLFVRPYEIRTLLLKLGA